MLINYNLNENMEIISFLLLFFGTPIIGTILWYEAGLSVSICGAIMFMISIFRLNK